MSVNKVILVGNLGRDPEVRHTQTGKAVANFTLATSRKWRDKDGQQQEQTEWHKIVAWDRLAEICTEYLSKGRQVYIEGRLQTRDWEDKEGNKRWTTEIVALDMKMLGRRSDYESGSGAQAPSDPPPPPGGGTGGSDDDIPF